MKNKKLIIHMINGDEYHLYDTKESILRIRNFDDMNFLEIDETIAKKIVYVVYYYSYHQASAIGLESRYRMTMDEKVLSHVAINTRNIVSIDYVEENRNDGRGNC